MKTKQLIHGDTATKSIVDDMLDGLVLTQPHLTLVNGHKVVLHRDFEHIRSKQVTLLAGGGSGHEPAHAGYIGEGMLTGVICGNVFASPTTLQVLTAIRLVAGPKGCLVIVKNYTGDRLNFGLAVEQAKTEGLVVDMVIVDEDVAVVKANAGRRGLCGTVLIHKLAGAAAASGMDLGSLVTMVNSVNRHNTLGTMGVALRPCTLPGHEGPSRVLGEDEMELGLGIHGEPGIETETLKPVATLTKEMIDRVCVSLGLDNNTARVVLMVNNLGTMRTMELLVVAKNAVEALKSKGITLERVMVGSFMTALDMYGFSLTLCNVNSSEEASAEMLLKYFDTPATATAWNYSPYNSASALSPQVIDAPTGAQSFVRPLSLNPMARVLESCIHTVCKRLIEAEPDLTRWDAQVGDGDCGHTFKSAAKRIENDMAVCYPLDNPAALLRVIAASVSASAGGTSGVLYTIMLTAAAVEMESQVETAKAPTHMNWAAAFHAGVAAVQRYGGAREGTRTMLDALLPADRAFKECTTNNSDTFDAVATAAEVGAEKTRTISTSQAFGRSGYVDESCATNVPDPGAMACAMWIRAVVNTLKNNA